MSKVGELRAQVDNQPRLAGFGKASRLISAESNSQLASSDKTTHTLTGCCFKSSLFDALNIAMIFREPIINWSYLPSPNA